MKRQYLLFILVISLALAACSAENDAQTQASGTDQVTQEVASEYADERFLKDLVKGLQARWDLTKKDKRRVHRYNEEYQEVIESYIEAELGFVEKYADASFRDRELQRNAVEYIQALRDCKYALQYITLNPVTYEEKIKEPSRIRIYLIKVIHDRYDLEFDDRYEEDLAEVLEEAEEIGDSPYIYSPSEENEDEEQEDDLQEDEQQEDEQQEDDLQEDDLETDELQEDDRIQD